MFAGVGRQVPIKPLDLTNISKPFKPIQQDIDEEEEIKESAAERKITIADLQMIYMYRVLLKKMDIIFNFCLKFERENQIEIYSENTSLQIQLDQKNLQILFLKLNNKQIWPKEDKSAWNDCIFDDFREYIIACVKQVEQHQKQLRQLR